ncbi:hypothetical protein OXB_3161 [Bacillus sp. OxB-1]|nr:hypothetical protein OXB_3161 [Bacillus sp. OxB-1]
MPSPPPEADTAAENPGSYPFLTIAGNMMVPIAATVAGEEPERAAKKKQATIVTSAKPPVKGFIKEFAKVINRLESPPVSIKEPAKMKNGIAIRGKESSAVKALCVRNNAGMSEIISATVTAIPIAIAIGMPINKPNSSTEPSAILAVI